MAAPIDFGNWQKSIDNIAEESESSKYISSFEVFKTNNDRVNYIFQKKLLKKVEWLPAYFTSCKSWHGKSSEVARVWKNKGNKYFQQKKYQDAANSYTESCLNAEVKEDVSVSLGNRSAALFHLGLYKDCLIDISRAVEHDFPPESMHKLLARKTSALIKLGQKQEAEECFQQLSSFVQSESFSLQGSRREEFMKEVDQLKKLKQELKEERSSQDRSLKEIPSVYVGINPIVRQASKAVSLSVTPEKGRHLLASRFIPKGSTLIVERPFAAVLLPDHYQTHCHHCFSPLPHTPIGCEQCTSVRFCNESCREAAWDLYHQIECRYLDLFHSVGIAHLSLRIILTAKLNFLEEFLRDEQQYRLSDDPLTRGLNSEGVYDRSYVAVYDLMTHEESTEPLDLLQYSMTGALLLVTLTHAGYFNKLSCSDSLAASMLGENGDIQQIPSEVLNIGGLLLRHILQLVCNAHAITTLQAGPGSDSRTLDTEQVRIATAIYPTASLMNHSCDPTIISSFVGDVLVVRTVKDVPKGEEIFNCYGPHCCRMRREERQEILKSQYHFVCLCAPCSAGDVINERFGAYKCPACAGILSGSSCQECGHLVSDQFVENLKKRMNETQEKCDAGMKLMALQKFEDALVALKKCKKERLEFLYKDHRDLALLEDAIARCYANQGDFSKSADHLFKSVKFAEQMYGNKSIEYAHELMKLAEVLFNAERFRECLGVADQCQGLFTSMYPPGHELVDQVTDLREAAQLALNPMMQTS
ncbi:SET and MYND domain-containing protein 4-like [Physella acuta]|uniref:SET and MYND domain-containing protein 4-like n=1 Tax=Physella acuta TaxID=109671 RepID=UPI0027DC9D02|nr:SET and MYND domain-containing protein 4-like [Physella acuta]